MYRELARALCKAGVAVARYDNRGVSCNEFTMPECPSTDELEITRHYLAHCIDFNVRRGITVSTNLEDIQSVYAYVTDRLQIQEEQVVVVAHSEGGLNTARLIGQQRITPRGVVFIGSIVESPKSVFAWQTIDRNIARMMSWDGDADGVVTRADVERSYPEDPFFYESGIPMEELLPESTWCEGALRELFTERYLQMKQDALSRDRRNPYPEPTPEFEVVNASYAWWRQWFEDDTPVINHLQSYPGEVCVHLGEIDPQTPVHRQIASARDWSVAGRLRFRLHKNRGHALREGEPLHGPMDEEAREQVVSDVISVFRS
jgi:pimeloyl-ACP methyl ester carboxylesterase